MRKESLEQRSARVALYESYKESGQTLTGFSRERGVTYWKAKSAVLKTEAERNVGTGNFQEMALPLGIGSDYTVTLRNGRELCIPPQFSEKRVRELIKILETC